ncbi:hypothetical protein [Hyphomicrobium sp.]|uniref:hypothetical protein n=1 Tax=Hyphomicrobium sp. TaxID=82 RepID=UPI0025B9AD8A|nr:hypothetical protein [Hyphomicrobium sp.]MCC7250593.1 hypothetical protein [Hyphomicrobium sp.]
MIKRTIQGLVCLLSAISVPAASPADAAEWWMLQQTDKGRECAPPIESEGVTLTPDVLMKQYPECKLMDETPSLDLSAVMVNCEGDIDRVFVFTKTKAGCERLAED